MVLLQRFGEAGGYSEATVPLLVFVICATDGSLRSLSLTMNDVSPTKDREDARASGRRVGAKFANSARKRDLSDRREKGGTACITTPKPRSQDSQKGGLSVDPALTLPTPDTKYQASPELNIHITSYCQRHEYKAEYTFDFGTINQHGKKEGGYR